VRANYHTHSDFCDGKASPAEMARAAKKAGYSVLGFSSHAPMPSGMRWAVKPERIPAYVAEIRRLKEAWAPGGAEAGLLGPMEVLLGLEVDWYPPESSPGDGRFDALGLDYVLASVHFVELPGAPPFTVDSREEEFRRCMVLAGGRGMDAVRDYYARLASMIEAGHFDILAHFDLVKKNNAGSAWFDEESPAYLAAAFGAAGLLRGRNVVVEVNLGGMARRKTTVPYPSLSILRHLRELRVPITFCADAHAPEHLGAHLDTARELARAAGYRGVAVLSGGRWREVGLDET
jgi:histidinol-phosphatase (PHP family)